MRYFPRNGTLSKDKYGLFFSKKRHQPNQLGFNLFGKFRGVFQ